MLQQIRADAAISISDLKRNPSAAIKAADGAAIAILNHNKASAYLIPAAMWEEILDKLDDIELERIVRERWNQPSVPVDLADL